MGIATYLRLSANWACKWLNFGVYVFFFLCQYRRDNPIRCLAHSELHKKHRFFIRSQRQEIVDKEKESARVFVHAWRKKHSLKSIWRISSATISIHFPISLHLPSPDCI